MTVLSRAGMDPVSRTVTVNQIKYNQQMASGVVQGVYNTMSVSFIIGSICGIKTTVDMSVSAGGGGGEGGRGGGVRSSSPLACDLDPTKSHLRPKK